MNKSYEAAKELLFQFSEIIQENRALRKLLEWADECGFTFDQIWDDSLLDEDKFIKDTKDMNYIDTMIYYAKRWIEQNEQD